MFYRFYDRYRAFNDRRFRPFPFRFHWGELGVPLLTIVKVDPLIKENGVAHRTSRYEVMNRDGSKARLVVRRGQDFFLRLYLNRDFDPSLDAISLVFTLDGVKKPQYGHRTFTVAPVIISETGRDDEELTATGWNVTLESVQSRSIKVKISPPADTLIGKWKIEIDTKRKNSAGAISFSLNELFYIIFNPWCPEDQVFLDSEEAREEYIMTEAGLIWRGNYKVMRPTVWRFSQFDEDILDCALYLLTEVGKVRAASRGDPVVISRLLSASVNSPDDGGALMGNWSSDFGGGTAPTKWLGSRAILQQFYKNKRSVKYAQCWVFAGVLTTVCRTLGLPCRVVTNYSSAHDTQGSLTVDYFVDSDGKIMEELNSDSVWNFHVWNEVWMERLDLGREYGGWQAIDATPQELSEDAYRCGPASVVAIKRGEVMSPYDNKFVFAEVNADKVFWRYNGPTQPLKLIRKDIFGIGKQISTKAIGSWSREDITDSYKYPEKSTEEREAMLKALRQSESLFSRYYLNEEFNDILFNFELRDDITIGEPFSVVLLIKNRSTKQKYRVSVILRVEVVIYTGKVGDPIKRLEVDRVIRPSDLDEVRLDISWEEYGRRLLDQCAFNISCLATVKDTDFEYFAQDDFRVNKPEIVIDRKSEAIVGYVLEATATVINPLPVPLKKARFIIEGPGLSEELKIKIPDTIPPGEPAVCSFSMVPSFEGRSSIVVKFYSTELDDVDGFLNLMVQPARSDIINY